MEDYSEKPEIRHFRTGSLDKRRNTQGQNSMDIDEPIPTEQKPDQEVLEPNMEAPINYRTARANFMNNTKRLGQKSRSHAKFDIFNTLKKEPLNEKGEYICSDNLKSNYFKSEVVSMHRSLVTKEMLTRNIALHDPEDRAIVINILRKKPQMRSKEEVMFTQEAMKNIKFFAQIENELDSVSFTNLFQSLCLERFSPGERIFNHGEPARKFYIIIQGSVYNLYKNDGLVSSEQKKDKKNQKSAEVSYNVDKLQRILQITTSEEDRKKKVELFNPGFWIMKTTGAGESFGEIGLQRFEEKSRTYSVVCREDALVGVWSIEDYNAIFAKVYEARYKDKISFLEKIDAFLHWTPSYVSAFAIHVEEVKLPLNKVILKQGEVSNYIYFIKSGEIELRKHTNLPDDERLEILGALEDKEKPGRNQIIKSKKQESIRLGKIVQGDYFGISATLEKKPSEFTATVSSAEAVLISINIYKFVRFVRDRITLDKLKEHISRRDAWHEDMTSNFLNINTIFSKNWTEQPSQGDSPLLSLKKHASAHISERSRLEKPPTVIIKSTTHSRENSIEGSRSHVQAHSHSEIHSRSRTMSGGVLFPTPNLDSKRFFNTNPNQKVSKFGVAYERHQIRLKKLFGDRVDRDEKSERPEQTERIEKTVKTENNERRTAKSQQNLQVKTSYEPSPERLIRDVHFNFARTSSRPTQRLSTAYSGYRSSSERMSIHTTTDEPTVLTTQGSPGIKVVTLPLKTKPLMSPQFEKFKKSSFFNFNDDSAHSSSTRHSVNFGEDNSLLKTEEVVCTNQRNFVKRTVLKRNTASTPGSESGVSTIPKVLSNFSKKL